MGQLQQALALQEAKLTDMWHQIQACGVVSMSLQVLTVPDHCHMQILNATAQAIIFPSPYKKHDFFCLANLQLDHLASVSVLQGKGLVKP